MKAIPLPPCLPLFEDYDDARLQDLKQAAKPLPKTTLSSVAGKSGSPQYKRHKGETASSRTGEGSGEQSIRSGQVRPRQPPRTNVNATAQRFQGRPFIQLTRREPIVEVVPKATIKRNDHQPNDEQDSEEPSSDHSSNDSDRQRSSKRRTKGKEPEIYNIDSPSTDEDGSGIEGSVAEEEQEEEDDEDEEPEPKKAGRRRDKKGKRKVQSFYCESETWMTREGNQRMPEGSWVELVSKANIGRWQFAVSSSISNTSTSD